MAKLAIKGHKERGKEVIALLEMLGGKNEHYLAGCEPGDYYHIIKGGAINNGYVYPEGFAIFTLEEFEKEFPYKVGDKVDCRMFGIRSVTRMCWNSSIDQILYSVKNEEKECDVMIACAKDLRPYNPEPVETSPDKAKAPALEGQDYCEGRCGYKIPEGFEFDKVENGEIVPAASPVITCQCIRVPVLNGHTAAVFVSFKKKPTKEQILKAWQEYRGLPQELELPSAPKQFIHYFEEDNRPQANIDRNLENGYAISLGRLREDTVYDYKFVGLSHNTVRGAAGGAVLCAELLKAQGYITKK